ncbi:hypothetical protein BVX97_06010 [bacterium E08(2017)]|nr:hypothetical protein BVX97_06010 [bacterium E08(2017)]
MMSDNQEIVNRMIEAAGHATQSLGVGRSLGQIFAFLYFSPEPRTLNDLTSELGISKGSASMGVRQLEQWAALEKIWVKGDRKDYYQANDDFGKIIKNAMLDMAGKRINDYSTLLDEVEQELETDTSSLDTDSEFISRRIAKMRDFQSRVQGIWSGVMLKMLTK